jgi:hypothetical protein
MGILPTSLFSGAQSVVGNVFRHSAMLVPSLCSGVGGVWKLLPLHLRRFIHSMCPGGAAASFANREKRPAPVSSLVLKYGALLQETPASSFTSASHDPINEAGQCFRPPALLRV